MEEQLAYDCEYKERNTKKIIHIPWARVFHILMNLKLRNNKIALSNAIPFALILKIKSTSTGDSVFFKQI